MGIALRIFLGEAPEMRRTRKSVFMQEGGYAFIYDEALAERKYERLLASVENRLTSLGVNGRVVRLAMFRSTKEIVEGVMKYGVSTLVVVGSDATLDKVMWFAPDLRVVWGYLPLFEPSKIADPLGIPHGIDSCETLAGRFIETLDVGKCGDRYFLSEVKATSAAARVSVNGQYEIGPKQGGTVIIRNIQTEKLEDLRSDAKDGLLDVVLIPEDDTQRSRWRKAPPMEETRLCIRTGTLTSPEPMDITIDAHTQNGMSFSLEICPQKLRMITGRTRRLSPKELPLPSMSDRG